MEKENIIISLGGSLIVPNEIDLDFLRKFRNLILKHLKKRRFFIYVGGGKTARRYQRALTEFGATAVERDWIGIETTSLNAKLIKTLFGNLCYPEIIVDPNKKIKLKLKNCPFPFPTPPQSRQSSPSPSKKSRRAS